MKILNAAVDDRRFDTTPQRPILSVAIDEMPVQTNPVARRDGWTTAKYGPLIEFTCPSDIEDERKFASQFNIIFPKFAPVVDIIVSYEGEVLEGSWGMALGRARNLLRKWETNWKLWISEYEAQHGRIGWVPTENQHTCAANFLDNERCDSFGTQHLGKHGIDYWYCADHMKDFRAAQYAARRSA